MTDDRRVERLLRVALKSIAACAKLGLEYPVNHATYLARIRREAENALRLTEETKT